MARITPCLENGKIARFVGEQGDKAHGSTEFIVIRGRSGVTESDFVYYLVKWDNVREFAIGQMTGSSGRQRVPSEALDHLTVTIPPLSQQRAIAHILGTLDDKIELNRRMNETLESMARALFKSWFVDFDPVRAKAEGRDPGLPPEIADLFPTRFVESELGEIPEGWEVGRFCEFVELIREQVNPLYSPEAEFHHYSIPAYDDGQNARIERGESIKSLKSRVPPGVVLLSKLNPEIERIWLVDVGPGERAVCSTEFLALNPRLPFTRGYVYCLARSSIFRRQLVSLATGTSKSHQRAQVEAILNLSVVTPSARIVSVFEQTVDKMLADAIACRRESRTLIDLRSSMLPKLVSGEILIDDAGNIPSGFLNKGMR
jgi:type I restriction enzyme S subunit